MYPNITTSTITESAPVVRKNGNILCACLKLKHACKKHYPERYLRHRNVTKKAVMARRRVANNVVLEKQRVADNIVLIAAGKPIVEFVPEEVDAGPPKVRDGYGNLLCHCGKIKSLCQEHYPERYNLHRAKANAGFQRRRKDPLYRRTPAEGELERDKYMNILCLCGKSRARCVEHFPVLFARRLVRASLRAR